MPIISVVLGEGRSDHQKRALCRLLTDAAVEAIGVQSDQVRVILHETRLEHYAVGGVTFAERANGSAEVSTE